VAFHQVTIQRGQTRLGDKNVGTNAKTEEIQLWSGISRSDASSHFAISEPS
jgi:hypothetical protein